HMPEDEQRKIGARGNLKSAVEALRASTPTPCEIEASAYLEKHGRHQQRLTHARAVDHAADCHDGGMGIGADPPEQEVCQMERYVKAEHRRRCPVDDAPASDLWLGCSNSRARRGL